MRFIYLPPERAFYDPVKHTNEFYPLADIYALGFLIWEALFYVHHGRGLSARPVLSST
jgi:hypothetical protein